MLVVGTPTLMEVGTVRPVLVATLFASKHPDVLVMIRSGMIGLFDQALVVAVDRPFFDRRLTH
jgi:hypothetical protein